MGRRIALALVVIALCVGGYFVVTHYRTEKQGTDGEVHWVDGQPTAEESARFAKENSGDTADGNSEHKERSARQDAITGAQNTDATPGTTPAPAPIKPLAQTAPAANPAIVTTPAPAPAAYQAPANTYSASNGSNGASMMPASDTQSANAMNGTHFGGSGHYEWYRQGNLTWRLDPANGGSCIAFATLEEWRKQIVYSHGCGRGV